MAKFISLDNLKQAVDILLVRIAKKVSIDSVAQLLGIKLTAEGSNSQTITTADGRIKITDEETGDEKTVATLEDSTQDINANTVTANKVVSDLFTAADGTVYCLPNASQSARIIATGALQGGIILTSRNRAFEYEQQVASATGSYRVHSNVYTQITVGAFLNPTPVDVNIDLIRSAGELSEYWVELRLIKANKVAFLLDNSEILWAGREPKWPLLNGKTIMVHVIGTYAEWSVAGMPDDDTTAHTDYGVGIVGRGSLEEARDETVSDASVLFQWILDRVDGNGNAVVKPIWHIGNGVFVDANGTVMGN